MSAGSRRGLPASLWPTPTQQLLLAAWLAEDGPARRAWAEARAVLHIDRLEPGTFALTPLLYRRLEAWGAEDPLLPKLKGLYRHSWTRNQLLLGQLKTIAEAFASAEIDMLAAGGCLLVATFYDEPALRPLDRLDLLVRRGDATAAAAELQSLGWSAARPSDLGRLERRPAVWFSRGDGRVVVLRTRIFPPEVSPWDDRITFELDGIQCGGLSAARQLLWTCLGEDRHQIWGRVQWLPDLQALVESGPGIDWECVLKDTEALRAGLPVRDALTYARELHVGIPPPVIERLQAVPTRARERIGHRVGRWERNGAAGKLVRRISNQPLRS